MRHPTASFIRGNQFDFSYSPGVSGRKDPISSRHSALRSSSTRRTGDMKGMGNLCLQSIAGKHCAVLQGNQEEATRNTRAPSSPSPGSAGAAPGNRSQKMGCCHKAPLAYVSQSSKWHTKNTEPNTAKHKIHRNIPNSFSSKHSWQRGTQTSRGARVRLRTAAALCASAGSRCTSRRHSPAGLQGEGRGDGGKGHPLPLHQGAPALPFAEVNGLCMCTRFNAPRAVIATVQKYYRSLEAI